EAGADGIWIDFPTPQECLRGSGILKKPLFRTVGSQNFPATPSAMKAAGIQCGDAGGLIPIALGAVDKALAEMQTTGRMVDAAKGNLSQDNYGKVMHTEELNARSRKYRLPAGGSGAER